MPPRLSLRLLPLLALAAFAGCAGSTPPAPPVAPVQRIAPVAAISRLVEHDDSHLAMELPVRELRRADGTGPTILLIGAIHVGDKAFYQKIQRRIDAADVTVFEGVKGGKAGPGDTDAYATFATMAGLVTQSSSMDMTHPHFINGDLTMDSMMAILTNESTQADPVGRDARLAIAQFSLLKSFLNSGGLMTFLLELSGDGSPEIRRMLAKQLLGNAGKDASPKLAFFSPRLGQLIVDDRNEAALAVVRREVAARRTGTIALLYGVAHMPKLEASLVAHDGYVPVSETWLRAMDFDIDALGFTDADLDELLAPPAGSAGTPPSPNI